MTVKQVMAEEVHFFAEVESQVLVSKSMTGKKVEVETFEINEVYRHYPQGSLDPELYDFGIGFTDGEFCRGRILLNLTFVSRLLQREFKQELQATIDQLQEHIENPGAMDTLKAILARKKISIVFEDRLF